MTAKQLTGGQAPDQSQYVTLTDGAGNLQGVSVTVAASDIEIGAVEIKNATTDDRVTVSAAGALKVDGAGTAGTATGGVVTVQGAAAMTPVQIGDNSGSLTVDAPVGTPAFVRLSDGSAAITTLAVSLASVPSHAVTNAGTFAVQTTTVNGVAPAFGSGANGATVQRVTIATDDTLVASLHTDLIAATPAGTNLIGRTAADASAATGGIPSTARLLSAAGTSGDATNVKASAGRLYAIQGANVRTSALYLKLYNSASAPTAGSGTPVKTLYLPASSAFTFDWPLGLTFSTGIGFTIVTTGADNGSTSCTAADIVALNLDYA